MKKQTKIAFEGNLKAQQPEININIDNLKNGTYTLRILCREKIIKTISIIKE